MGFLQWLESTALAEWVATSIWGYPISITAHSVGLALVVGVAFVMNLRFLGVASAIPVAAMEKFIPWAWIGFAINAISGGLLFTYQGTWYVTNVPFLIKILFVAIGVVTLVLFQRGYKTHKDALASGQIPGSFKAIAIVSLVAWSIAMITGRFIAYLG